VLRFLVRRLLLALVFSVTLGWFPVSGRGTLAHLVLPAITLGAPLAAVLARMTRASVIEELRGWFAARSCGRARSTTCRRRSAWLAPSSAKRP
jgi:ABC-type dipeptide/oligopeptide/nickel transport system permease component